MCPPGEPIPRCPSRLAHPALPCPALPPAFAQSGRPPGLPYLACPAGFPVRLGPAGVFPSGWPAGVSLSGGASGPIRLARPGFRSGLPGPACPGGGFRDRRRVLAATTVRSWRGSLVGGRVSLSGWLGRGFPGPVCPVRSARSGLPGPVCPVRFAQSGLPRREFRDRRRVLAATTVKSRRGSLVAVGLAHSAVPGRWLCGALRGVRCQGGDCAVFCARGDRRRVSAAITVGRRRRSPRGMPQTADRRPGGRLAGALGGRGVGCRPAT